MQIEPVCNPSGDNVPEQSRKRILLPRDVTFRDALHDIFGHVIRHARSFQSRTPLRMPESRTEWDDHLQCPGDTQDAADARPIELATSSVARVFQRPLRSDHPQQLRRVDRLQVVR